VVSIIVKCNRVLLLINILSADEQYAKTPKAGKNSPRSGHDEPRRISKNYKCSGGRGVEGTYIYVSRNPHDMSSFCIAL